MRSVQNKSFVPKNPYFSFMHLFCVPLFTTHLDRSCFPLNFWTSTKHLYNLSCNLFHGRSNDKPHINSSWIKGLIVAELAAIGDHHDVDDAAFLKNVHSKHLCSFTVLLLDRVRWYKDQIQRPFSLKGSMCTYLGSMQS